MITETTFNVTHQPGGSSWIMEASNGAHLHCATEDHAIETGKIYAYDHTPIVIGAKHQGYTIIAAVPNGERRFIVAGEDDELKKPFITWVMVLSRHDSRMRTFEDARFGYEKLSEAIADMVRRAGLTEPGSQVPPVDRLM
jgi:hypothetical protein